MNKNPLVGAIHKSCFQDLVVNLQLEMIDTFLGLEEEDKKVEDHATLKDLPNPEAGRALLARALKRMKKEDYNVLISGDMLLFYDTGDEKEVYQRQPMPQAVMTQRELDIAPEAPAAN